MRYVVEPGRLWANHEFVPSVDDFVPVLERHPKILEGHGMDRYEFGQQTARERQ
jgi:hypothetical protein